MVFPRLRDESGRYDSRPTAAQEERFEALYLRSGPNECWPWLGAKKNAFGHGAFKLGGRSTPVVFAHRFAWEKANGSIIPSGLVIRHSCDNPTCVNPAHLQLGTNADNTADKIARGRHLFGEKAPGAKLTEDSVRRIKAMPHVATKHVAALFGISRQTIADIRARRTWAHV